jgi:NAD(P)-dependent dehydrogenase (short-subunit alcohol dehydrogenase family)
MTEVDQSFNQDLSLNALFGVKNKCVVVTGGSKGIGLMIASGFVQNGARVYIFSRNPATEIAAALSEKGPGVCVSMTCDVSDRAQIDAVVAQVSAKESGGVHVLVNNSGATWGSSFDETPRKSWDKLNAVNVVGLFECSQAFMPLLEKTASVESPARIINIASIDGIHTPAIEEYAYAATKAGVLHLTRVMAGYLSKRNVTCNSISPGLFPSKMGSQVLDVLGEELVNKSIPLGRAGRPSDIASASLFLAGQGGAYTTGANIVIDGGVVARL